MENFHFSFISESTLDLDLRLLGGFTLQVSNMDIEAEPTDTIANIKFKIQEVSGISPAIMVLELNDQELEDGKTLSDYNILTDANLGIFLRNAQTGWSGFLSRNGIGNDAIGDQEATGVSRRAG